MFCSNCGKQLEDNVSFCPECGTKVAVATTPVVEEPAKSAESKAEETPVKTQTTTVPVAERTTETPAAAAPIAPTPAEPQKKNKGPIIVIIILALLVVALGIAILFLYNDKKQDKDDDWESTEAFADEDEEDEEEEAAPTPEPTEEPTPEPTEEPTPEPTEVPTPEPTEAPTPEPTEEPTPEPTEDPEAEPTEDPEVEPTEDPEEELPGSTKVWNDPVFDIDPSAYEKYTVYETSMDVNGLSVSDKQTILANGDFVGLLVESTTIDLSDYTEDDRALYAEAYDEIYAPLCNEAPQSVTVLYGLDDTIYRVEIMINLEGANLKDLIDTGYLTILSGSSNNIMYVSYEQTCLGLEESGYVLVE